MILCSLALSSCVCSRYQNDRVEVNYVQRLLRYQRWAQYISCLLGFGEISFCRYLSPLWEVATSRPGKKRNAAARLL